jgi:Ca2+-binding EF-hand superfamily protein
MVRSELSKALDVGGVTIEQAINLVETEVLRWNCSNYMHITRAIAVQNGQVINLETMFSKPTQEKPVPIAVICVYFNLDVETGELTYQFEQENVQHKVGGQSLADGKFECWLDRIIGDKLQVRQRHDLKTPFESSRLAPPSQISDHGSEADGEEIQFESQMEPATEAVAEGTVMSRAPSKEKLPLGTLLANIFDAADEDKESELTHKEVADLLYATPLGLADWDIKLLLTTAHERNTGKIEYKPFVQAAPEIIEALLKRRAAYNVRKQLNVQVSNEAIELCYGEEIEEISRAAKEAFAAVDAGGNGTLSRHEFRSCLMSRNERFSMQEVQLLMQMCKEDDFGQVPYDDFVVLLQGLRIDALHNALVETDIEQLRIHLILLLRREGFDNNDPVLPVWSLKNVLLAADQLCLSRMQIHVILSIVHPSEHGEVDVEYFLRVACTVIPYMFDAATFMEKASTIAKEKADALAKAELEELQGLTSSMTAKRRTDEDQEEDIQANAPDRDAVEKALIHNASQYDEKHRQQPTLHYQKFMEAMRHESVQQCQLSEAELRGFIAEAEIDERHEIGYVEHIKTWVPIIFELRKSRVYDNIISKDWGVDAANLTDLSEYEARFPLLARTEEEEAVLAERRKERQSTGRQNRRLSSRSLQQGFRRSSTKENLNLDIKKERRSSGSKARPASRQRERPQSASRQKSGGHSGRHRPTSRTGSQHSIARSHSSDSLDSRASMASHASRASHRSTKSRN